MKLKQMIKHEWNTFTTKDMQALAYMIGFVFLGILVVLMLAGCTTQQHTYPTRIQKTELNPNGGTCRYAKLRCDKWPGSGYCDQYITLCTPQEIK